MATIPPSVEAAWPRPYQLHQPANNGSNGPIQFSSDLFRGPDNRRPVISYSDNYNDSERIARRFLGESVVGFDMEWVYPERTPAPRPLQEMICSIQVAKEDEIALIHIGRHQGRTPEDLLAPSLRRLIEDPGIRKTGQSIMGDFWRLKTYFAVQPKGAFELSYFHTLLVRDEPNYETRYITGGLRRLVEIHFPGLSLYKDVKMHTDWQARLNARLAAYAAADAYSSLMLFHRMNARRLEMRPCPPLPRPTEEYMRFSREWPLRKVLQLEPLRPGAHSLEATQFLWVHQGLEEDEESALELDENCQMLYNNLTVRRGEVATFWGLPHGHIATDSALRNVAKYRPYYVDECSELQGLGFEKHRKWLAHIWIACVWEFEENVEGKDFQQPVEESDASVTPKPPPRVPSSHRYVVATDSNEGSGTVATDISDRPPRTLPANKRETAAQPVGNLRTIEDATQYSSPRDPSPETLEAMANLADAANPFLSAPPLPTPSHNDPLPLLHTGLSFSLAEADLTDPDTEPDTPDTEAAHTALYSNEPRPTNTIRTLSKAGPAQSSEPILHTGLSFSMADTGLADGDGGAGDEDAEDGVGRDVSPKKRKRSPDRDGARKSPVKNR